MAFNPDVGIFRLSCIIGFGTASTIWGFLGGGETIFAVLTIDEDATAELVLSGIMIGCPAPIIILFVGFRSNGELMLMHSGVIGVVTGV